MESSLSRQEALPSRGAASTGLMLPHLVAIGLTMGAPLLQGESAHPDLAAGLQSNGTEQVLPATALSEASESRSRALALYYRGILQEKSGRAGAAVETYRQILEIEPDGIELAIHASGLLAGQSREREALAMMERTLRGNPESIRAHVAMSKLCAEIARARGGDEDLQKRAFAIAAKAVRSFPESTAAVAHLAQYTLNEKGRSPAGVIVDQAAARDVRRGDYWLEIAKVAGKVWPINHGDTRKAHLAKVNPLYEKALKFYRRAPEPDAVRKAAAQYFYQTSQFPLAMEVFEALLQDRPDLLGERETLLNIYKRLSMTDKLIASLEDLADVNPFDSSVQMRLYEHYREAKRYAEAADSLEAAIRTGNAPMERFTDLMSLRSGLDEKEEALNVARRAFRRYPEEIGAHFLVATALGQLDRNDEAVAALETTIKLAAQKEVELNESFYYQYGVCLAELERFDEAATQFRTAISKVPDSRPEDAARSLNHLGYTWLEQGMNIDEAGQMIERANELVPNEAAYVDSLGWFYFLKERYDDALATLLESERLLLEKDPEALEHPRNAVIFDHVGQAYFQTDQPAEAVAYLEKAVRLDPTEKGFTDRLEEYRKAVESKRHSSPAAKEIGSAEASALADSADPETAAPLPAAAPPTTSQLQTQ